MNDRKNTSRLPMRWSAGFLDGDWQEIQLLEIREKKERERVRQR
jgi:hypothetical protein